MLEESARSQMRTFTCEGGGTCSSELCSLLWCQGSIQRVSESFLSCSGCLSVVSESILACPVPSASLSRRVPELPYSCGDQSLIRTATSRQQVSFLFRFLLPAHPFWKIFHARPIHNVLFQRHVPWQLPIRRGPPSVYYKFRNSPCQTTSPFRV